MIRLPSLISLALTALSAPLHALTVAEVTAIHNARAEPYELRSFTVDDATRRSMAEDMAYRDPQLRNEVMVALSQRFDGATIHVYRQTDTTLVSHITAFEVGGEVVLLNFHSTAFFEIPALVERRIALFDAVVQAMDPAIFQPGWTERTFGESVQAAHDYADGTSAGDYPGWSYAAPDGYQTLGMALVPDWVAITVTSLTDCPPRYPNDGWALVFLCNGR